MEAKRRAVFLDRDGVLNRALVRDGRPYPPRTLAELEVLPGVGGALSRLKAAGFLLVVVTNQPDVARGTGSRAGVDAMNAELRLLCPMLDDILVCAHDDADGCACRKPKPGLLLDGAKKYGVALEESYMVGDRWRDVEAGQRAGCKTIWINVGYNERGPERNADFEATSLVEATQWILRDTPVWNGGMPSINDLKIEIFGDGADKAGILDLYKLPYIKGFTTNPTLMRKAGLTDYEAFAKDILAAVPDRPFSFEVFSDDFAEMHRQALKIKSWGENVVVKIPITNTKRQSACPLIAELAAEAVRLNITAITTLEQVRESGRAAARSPLTYISVFAGRVADTGRDPVPMMTAAVEILRPYSNEKLLWASPRELLNIFQADAIGCHIITVTHDVLKKLSLVNKDLAEYSLETVKMFYDDASKAGYKL